ncbi:MAG: response regulator [Spirochaetes bacterium]|nr:response regulator [Spirochaetota bacterium]
MTENNIKNEDVNKNVKILIIDDIMYMRMLIKKLLIKNNFSNFREAKDGATAIEAFKEFDPDIILLDLLLPKISGLDLIKIFRDINYKIKILVISAVTNKDTQVKAIEKGALDYMTKPVKEDILIKKLNKLITTEAAISQNTIDTLSSHARDFSEKIGIKLDSTKSVQILSIYGVLGDEDITDIKKTLISLQLYNYKSTILNLNGVTDLNTGYENIVKLKDEVEKKSGKFFIVLLKEDLIDKLKDTELFNYIVKTESQAFEKIT